jgi:hypothetical protein
MLALTRIARVDDITDHAKHFVREAFKSRRHDELRDGRGARSIGRRTS